MSLLCVQDLKDNLLNIYNLYHTSFDEDIRAPWKTVESKLNTVSEARVFTDNMVPSGFVMWTAHPTERAVFIDYFCVSVSLQGRGLGRKYFQQVLSYLETRFDYIILDCKGDVVKFYDSLGMKVVATTIYAPTGTHLTIMLKSSVEYEMNNVLKFYSDFQ